MNSELSASNGNDAKLPNDQLANNKLFRPISPCPSLKQDPLTALSSLTATTPSLDFSPSIHWCAYSPAFSWCQTFWCVRVVYNFVLLFSNPIIALSSSLAEFKTAGCTAEVPHVPEKGSFAFCTSTYSILGKWRKKRKKELCLQFTSSHRPQVPGKVG